MLTHAFWQKYKCRIVGAGIGAFLHFVMFVLAGLTSEGGGFLIIGFVDFPLWILAELFSLREKYYVILFGLGGSLGYALLGWFIGPFLKNSFEQL